MVQPHRLYRPANVRLWVHKRRFIVQPHSIHFPTTTTAYIVHPIPHARPGPKLEGRVTVSRVGTSLNEPRHQIRCRIPRAAAESVVRQFAVAGLMQKRLGVWHMRS